MPHATKPPPRWADRLLAWFCAPHLHEAIQGDLHELYAKWVAELGETRANRKYVLSVLGFLRPFVLKRKSNPHFTNFIPASMLRNYLTIAFRNLRRQAVFSVINGFGLAVGIAFCLLIFLFVHDERSFDRFHAKADRIYRLELNNLHEQAKTKKSAAGLTNPRQGQYSSTLIGLPLPLGPALASEMPEIETFVRFNESGAVVSNGKDSFEENIQYTDTNFFDVFSFDLLQGQKDSVLADLANVVITERIAVKYFGNQNPIGQILQISRQGTPASFRVSGVVQEAPANSSIRFDILLRMEQRLDYGQYKNEMQSNFSVFTFLLLSPNASPHSLAKKLQPFVDDRLNAFSDMYRQQEKLDATVRILQPSLTLITDTHFDTRVNWPRVSNPVYSYILAGIALLILAVACINYISFLLTSAASRLKEIGIRKVMGAHRRQVIGQLWVESQVLVWLAMLLAIGLAYLFLPLFNTVIEKSLSLMLWREPILISALLLIALLVSIVAGGYPAVILSNFQPTTVLKSARTYRVNPWFSKVLLVMQYSTCLFLVSSSLIMYRQMRYVSEKDLGFDKEQVLIVENFAGWGKPTAQLINRFRQWASTHPNIVSVSGTSATITKPGISTTLPINQEQVFVNAFLVDEHYLSTLGIKLVEGKNFSPDIKTDQEGIIINETLANMLSQDSTGAGLSLMGGNVLGIVEDHHYASLESKIAPMVFTYQSDFADYVLIKMRPGRVAKTLHSIEKTWKRLAPDQPFVYSFLDENLAEQYKTYRNWVGMVGVATAFAIFIACLGLFGLSGLSAVNRTKEIGIRKVLGASVSQLFLLLNQDTIRLTMLSFIIAVPLAWYLMHRWLDDFAYRITISWELFAVAGLLGLLTAFAAVSYHSIRAARANPVDSLRSE